MCISNWYCPLHVIVEISDSLHNTSHNNNIEFPGQVLDYYSTVHVKCNINHFNSIIQYDSRVLFKAIVVVRLLIYE